MLCGCTNTWRTARWPVHARLRLAPFDDAPLLCWSWKELAASAILVILAPFDLAPLLCWSWKELAASVILVILATAERNLTPA
ncbi:hypothetical protein NDU88_005078 [Pleurodeles waltl]|uniref:Uncharacterized protein n=1 Tax=Pleurodeles waltl TaxID=8319 RepID=A0AAV7SKN9_PLEWA|nr:hypothetical protein NDU88_005078 [Pleurodeles waltl]